MPRSWDATFDSRLACLFIERFRQWVRPTRELPCSSEDLKWSLHLLERRGFVFEHDPAKGCRLVGWERWPRKRPRKTAPAPRPAKGGG